MKKNLLGTNREFTINYKSIGIVALFIFVSNWLTYKVVYPNETAEISAHIARANPKESLYLLKHAQNYVYDAPKFEEKVRQISSKLNIPPEWLMAVMHAESRFDASATNKKGGGTAGLIQFTPQTAQKMGITLEQLRNMNHLQQLDFIYQYLNEVQQKNHPFNSLTELYIGVLYPDGLAEDYCFSLYQSNEDDYHFHSGLDEDKDGRITLQDIDKFMKRIYPTAYQVPKNSGTIFTRVFGL